MIHKEPKPTWCTTPLFIWS